MTYLIVGCCCCWCLEFGLWDHRNHPMYEPFYRSLKLQVSNAYNDNVGYVDKCFDI